MDLWYEGENRQIRVERHFRGCVPLKPTIFRHLPGASLQQQPDPPASRLDEFDGTGMSHVPSAVPINLYDLISHLEETNRGKMHSVSVIICLFKHSWLSSSPTVCRWCQTGDQVPLRSLFLCTSTAKSSRRKSQSEFTSTHTAPFSTTPYPLTYSRKGRREGSDSKRSERNKATAHLQQLLPNAVFIPRLGHLTLILPLRIAGPSSARRNTNRSILYSLPPRMLKPKPLELFSSSTVK